jgi:hypothetical protein
MMFLDGGAARGAIPRCFVKCAQAAEKKGVAAKLEDTVCEKCAQTQGGKGDKGGRGGKGGKQGAEVAERNGVR